MTAEAGRLGAGSVTACTADTVGTCTTTGDATPVKECPAARELFANVMLPATCENRSQHDILHRLDTVHIVAIEMLPTTPAMHGNIQSFVVNVPVISSM